MFSQHDASPNFGLPRVSTLDRVRLCLLSADDNGQAAIEMALSLPLLLLMMTGITAFGLTISNYQQLLHGNLVAVQQLAISRGQTLDPCATAASALQLSVPNLKTSSIGYTFSINGTAYTGSTCSSTSTATGAAGNLVQGGYVTMTVTYPCSLQTYNKNFAPNCQLSSTSTELIQ